MNPQKSNDPLRQKLPQIEEATPLNAKSSDSNSEMLGARGLRTHQSHYFPHSDRDGKSSDKKRRVKFAGLRNPSGPIPEPLQIKELTHARPPQQSVQTPMKTCTSPFSQVARVGRPMCS